MKIKVFISGPMSGIEDFNTKAFKDAEEFLKSKGFSVFNPSWLMFDETWTRKEMLRIDIAALSTCDAIYMLDGWDNSAGAKAEFEYAKASHMKLLFQNDVVDIEDAVYGVI